MTTVARIDETQPRGPSSASAAERARSAADVLGDPAALTEDDTTFLASLPRRLREVNARRSVSRDSLPELGDSAQEPALSAATQQVWDAEKKVASALAERYRALAGLHIHDAIDDGPVGDEDPDSRLEAEVDGTRAAIALRVTYGAATWQLRDAHKAVHSLPRTLTMLETGEFSSWRFERMLRKARHLTEESRLQIDCAIATWSVDITAERFVTLLNALIQVMEGREKQDGQPLPDPPRSVELASDPCDGTGEIVIRGPVPDILSRWKQLDEAARAIQAAQRKALKEGTAIPFDEDGVVAESGRATPLKELRYLLMTTSPLETDGVQVPAERFRLNVTVPALTLLGVSDAPGMLEGHIALPAEMARLLAGNSATWNRLLTDPVTAAFLPLPAETYEPTRAMLEYLRHRNSQCALPGCTRPSSWASECDHLIECLRNHPEAGGLTEIQNLHLLCWQHHLAKTQGLLDPSRLPAAGHSSDRTRWKIGTAGDEVTVVDDVDPVHHLVMRHLELSWNRYCALRDAAASPPTSHGASPAGTATLHRPRHVRTHQITIRPHRIKPSKHPNRRNRPGAPLCRLARGTPTTLRRSEPADRPGTTSDITRGASARPGHGCVNRSADTPVLAAHSRGGRRFCGRSRPL